MSILVVASAFLLNLIYFFISLKLKIKIFMNYCVNFLFYTTGLLIILKILKIEFFFNNFPEFITLYTLFFISFFLSMTTKFIKSPTHLIFLCLKKKRTIKEIINFLEKKNIIISRLADLKKQKIIFIKKNKICLKKNTNFTINILFFLKKFLCLKSEG